MKFEEIPDTPQNGFEDIAPLEKPEEEKPERSYGGQALEDEEQLAASMYPGTSIPLGLWLHDLTPVLKLVMSRTKR